MNFPRWSARLPGTRRAAAARTDRGSVPGARGEYEQPPVPPSAPPTDIPALEELSVREILGGLPALVALVYGPEHRVAYVNGAYEAAFGPRTIGERAAESCPELAELGLLPLLDQVLRSGKPRTVKSRKLQPRDTSEGEADRAVRSDRTDKTVKADKPDRRGEGSYTVTCTPVGCDGGGVLIFAADVTDHAEAAERLRTSERRHRQTAVTLQRSLLPQKLEQPDDLRVAATYQPGGEDAAVGGDWYDVITLGAGRTALVDRRR